MEPVERCDFCKTALTARHRHVLDIINRKILCSCDGCLIAGTMGRKQVYKLVPNRYMYLTGFQMPDSLWNRFMIPVGMAFFFFSSKVNRIAAFYPSPFGAIESEQGLEAWKDLELLNPVLAKLEPDVEALLVRKTFATGADAKAKDEYYLVPIDECYRLVGVIRSGWRGITGGHEVQDKINRFFEDLKDK